MCLILMFLELTLPNSFNHLLIVLSKQSLNKRIVHIKRFRSVFTRHSINIVFEIIICILSMLCSWAGLPRATGYSRKYMNYLHPLDWTLFVLKTMCECSPRLKPYYYSKKFFRNKAVSDGAISFYLDHFVRTRVSKFTYGTFCRLPYDSNDPDHKSRSDKVITSVSGNKWISESFSIILPKVSCLILFLEIFIKRIYFVRIPKFRRRRNSENHISGNQVLQLVFDLVLIIFGATVEMSWLQSGRTLIPVRVISQSFIELPWWPSIFQTITRSFVL